ncbi:MAG TPA: hypothetical protein VM187_12030 [Niastella sp.]|nr:hypothetical protein [Niastella sp.]
MKKVKISLAALVLVIAVAGTATANANKGELELCIDKDPGNTICTNASLTPCCEDDFGNTNFERSKLEM